VRKDGRITKVGEYARVYNESANSFTTSGVPMWGCRGDAKRGYRIIWQVKPRFSLHFFLFSDKYL